nr:TIR domain-containing protein [Parerythrobacter lutipelagi]
MFLSYNREDAAIAQTYADAFEREGFDVWWDATLKSGEAYDEVTEAALRSAKAVVVLWSPRSVVSRWVRAEATVAYRNKTLMPVMIEPCERPVMFELTQTAELGHWQGAADDPTWRSFVQDVQSLVGKSNKAQDTPAPDMPPSKPAADRSEMAEIALLPFADLSTDKDQQSFIDGLNEEIRDGMTTVARTAQVDGKGISAPYRLEGSVRGSAERLRVTVKLVQSSDGKQLWSKSFDGARQDELAFQEQIASTIEAQIRSHIFKAEVVRLQNIPDGHHSALDYVLKSIALITNLDTKSIKLALEYAGKAIALNPHNAVAHAVAARHYSMLYLETGDWNPDEVYRSALDHASKAMHGAEQDSNTLQFLFMAMASLGGDLDPLEAMAERLLTKTPNNSSLLVTMGAIKALQGKKTAESRMCLDTAIRLNPNWEGDIYVLAMQMACHFELGEFALAAERANEIIFRRENFTIAQMVAAASYAHLEEMDAARKALAQIRPEMKLNKLLVWFRDTDTREMLRSGLKLAGANI